MPETNGHQPLDSDYWVHNLAAAIGIALVTKPFEMSKAGLRRALKDFSSSKSCNAELRTYIRELKGER